MGFQHDIIKDAKGRKSSRIELMMDPAAEIPLECGLYRSTENRVHTAFQARFVLCKLR